MFLLLLISLFIAIFFEATVVSLPLSFILLFCYSVLNRSGKVFATAFVTGLAIDILFLRPLGLTALYFLLFFTFVLLYQRKYEIRSYFFVTVGSFVGSYLYLQLLFGHVLPGQAVVSTVIAVLIFLIGKKLRRKKD
jgi:cell shape-determining protein MreD